MWILLICLIAGGIVGFFLPLKKKHEMLFSRIQLFCLYFIVFVMGLKIGSDDKVIAYIGTLGLQAAVLAAGTIGGSVILTYAGVMFFKKQWKGSHGNDHSDTNLHGDGNYGREVDASQGINSPS